MSKLAKAGIGIAMIGAVLALIFGISERQNRENIEALQTGSAAFAELSQEESTAPAEAGPAAAGTVYEAKNDLHPGMVFSEETSAETASSETEVPSGEEQVYPDESGFLDWQGETYKRNAHVKADLLIGVDDGGVADFMAVVVHDTSKNELKMLMIPRDSMMEMYQTDTEGNSRPVVTHIALSHSGPGTPEEKAMRTVEAVEQLLCGTKVDHYMAGDISLIADVTDLAGGVPVIVPNDELQKIDPLWKKGTQIILQGPDAERFIRYRDTDVDGTPLTRMDQHKAYIAGLYQRLGENRDLAVKLSDFVENRTTSDMSKGEYEKILIDALTCGFDPQKDVQILPGTMTEGEENGTVYDQFYVNYEEVIPVLLDSFYRKVN